MSATTDQVLSILRQPGRPSDRVTALKALIRHKSARAKALWAAFDADPSLFEEHWLHHLEGAGGDPRTLLRLLGSLAERCPDGRTSCWGLPRPFWQEDRGDFPGLSWALVRLLGGWRSDGELLVEFAEGVPLLPELYQDGAWFALLWHGWAPPQALTPRLLAKAAETAAWQADRSPSWGAVQAAWPREEWDAASRRAALEGRAPIASFRGYAERLPSLTPAQAAALARRLRGGPDPFRDCLGVSLESALDHAFAKDPAAARALAPGLLAAAAEIGEGAWERRVASGLHYAEWPDATLLWTALGLARLADVQAPPEIDPTVRGFLAAWQPSDGWAYGEDSARCRAWMAEALRAVVPPDRLERLFLEAKEFPWILAEVCPTTAVRERALAALGEGSTWDDHGDRIGIGIAAFGPAILPGLAASQPGTPAARKAVEAALLASGDPAALPWLVRRLASLPSGDRPRLARQLAALPGDPALLDLLPKRSSFYLARNQLRDAWTRGS